MTQLELNALVQYINVRVEFALVAHSNTSTDDDTQLVWTNLREAEKRIHALLFTGE